MFKLLLPVVLGLGSCDSQTLRQLMVDPDAPRIRRLTQRDIREIEKMTKDVERMWEEGRKRLFELDRSQDKIYDICMDRADQHITMFRAIGDDKQAKEWEQRLERYEKERAKELAYRQETKHLRYKGDLLGLTILMNQEEIAQRKAKGESTEFLEERQKAVMNLKANRILVDIAGYFSKICKYIHDKPARQVITWSLWGLF